jgi:hypothetical protein
MDVSSYIIPAARQNYAANSTDRQEQERDKNINQNLQDLEQMF